MSEKVFEVEIVPSLVTCHRCGTKNRLHPTKSYGRYRCGSCHAVIRETFLRRRFKWNPHFSPRGWAIIAACGVVLMFVMFAPWPHFEWATIRDRIDSYEAFIKRFPESGYVADAKDRIRKLRDDDVWDKAVASGRFDSFKNYVKVYPDGKHLAGADNRIQGFYNDWNWVRAQDNLSDYQRFAGRFPGHPQMAWLQKRIIDLEVKGISAGKFSEMPRAQPRSFGGLSVEIEVENRTGYELTVRYSGPDSQKHVLPKGETRTIRIQPGDYKVAASVSAANVTNYYGKDKLGAGKYSSSFYVETSINGISIPSYPFR